MESNARRRISALESAVEAGNREALEAAAESLADFPGMTPLMVAASFALGSACEGIAKRWPEMGGASIEDGSTALIFAVKSCEPGAKKSLVAMLGVEDQLARDAQGMTAMAWAAAEGVAGCLEPLLGPGSPSPLDRDVHGASALALALLGGFDVCVEMLWEASKLGSSSAERLLAAREACSMDLAGGSARAAVVRTWLSAQADQLELDGDVPGAEGGAGAAMRL